VTKSDVFLETQCSLALPRLLCDRPNRPHYGTTAPFTCLYGRADNWKTNRLADPQLSWTFQVAGIAFSVVDIKSITLL